MEIHHLGCPYRFFFSGIWARALCFSKFLFIKICRRMSASPAWGPPGGQNFGSRTWFLIKSGGFQHSFGGKFLIKMSVIFFQFYKILKKKRVFFSNHRTKVKDKKTECLSLQQWSPFIGLSIFSLFFVSWAICYSCI